MLKYDNKKMVFGILLCHDKGRVSLSTEERRQNCEKQNEEYHSYKIFYQDPLYFLYTSYNEMQVHSSMRYSKTLVAL